MSGNRGKVRRQRRITGGRTPAHAGLDPRVEAIVADTTRRFGVTRAMVISIALADWFGIEEEDAAWLARQGHGEIRRIK